MMGCRGCSGWSCGLRFRRFKVALDSGVPRNFVRWGVQQIQLRTEDRESGELGVVAP